MNDLRFPDNRQEAARRLRLKLHQADRQLHRWRQDEEDAWQDYERQNAEAHEGF